MDKDNIYVWDGNYYALAVTERLGLEETGGMVRVGPVHYNTTAEIQKFGEALTENCRVERVRQRSGLKYETMLCVPER